MEFSCSKETKCFFPAQGESFNAEEAFSIKKEHFKNTNSHINPQTDFFSGRPIRPLNYFLISNKERLKMDLHFKYLITLLDRLLWSWNSIKPTLGGRFWRALHDYTDLVSTSVDILFFNRHYKSEEVLPVTIAWEAIDWKQQTLQEWRSTTRDYSMGGDGLKTAENKEAISSKKIKNSRPILLTWNTSSVSDKLVAENRSMPETVEFVWNGERLERKHTCETIGEIIFWRDCTLIDLIELQFIREKTKLLWYL